MASIPTFEIARFVKIAWPQTTSANHYSLEADLVGQDSHADNAGPGL